MSLTIIDYSQSGHTFSKKVCLFKNSFFSGAKEKTRRKISYSQKSSRAIRVILYTRILARILLARTTRAQTNLFVSVSFEREREKIEKEREKSFSLCLFVCVCVCLSAFVSREVWSFKDGRRCGNSR